MHYFHKLNRTSSIEVHSVSWVVWVLAGRIVIMLHQKSMHQFMCTNKIFRRTESFSCDIWIQKSFNTYLLACFLNIRLDSWVRIFILYTVYDVHLFVRIYVCIRYFAQSKNNKYFNVSQMLLSAETFDSQSHKTCSVLFEACLTFTIFIHFKTFRISLIIMWLY